MITALDAMGMQLNVGDIVLTRSIYENADEPKISNFGRMSYVVATVDRIVDATSKSPVKVILSFNVKRRWDTKNDKFLYDQPHKLRRYPSDVILFNTQKGAMTMRELLKQELDKYSIFQAPDDDFINALTRAIPFATVPDKMKLVIAISHLTNFAGQFRRNIVLWDDTPVPINSISFVIAGSGANKDSSNNAVRKCFKPGFQIIEEELQKQVKKDAIEHAKNAGEDPYNEYSVYKDYIKPIPPVFMSITTGPGLVKHINDIGDLPLSSSFLYSGEISDELANNINAVDNIKILSEVYDLGIKEITYTKNEEFRSQEIDGQPVSALFMGSPGHILYDEATKKKFHIAFMSKLARRSWFCYEPNDIPEPDFSTEKNVGDATFAYAQQIIIDSKEARAAVADYVKDITLSQIKKKDMPITVEEEVFKLFEIYKRYNREVINSLPNRESTYALIRAHLQWKALKFAGALALINQRDEITTDDYSTAMQFCELLDSDMEQFEYDLNKAPHERFSDFIRKEVSTVNNKALVSIHDIKKHGFATQVSRNKLLELVKLCAGYDTNGVYSIVNEDGAIQYEPIIKTDIIGISYKEINNSKLNRAVKAGDQDAIDNAKNSIATSTGYGYTVDDTTFEELGEMLLGDFAYSPFKFRNGNRGKNNIIGGTKWLVLDVDDSVSTASEVHFMLSDINHHIALSSDPDNEYKFRVLLELDASVEISAPAWKHFFLEIAHDLGLQVDPLPQSQIFFSYADRPVLSVTDAESIQVRDYVMSAVEKANVKAATTTKVSSAQARTQLEDPLETFSYAFNAEDGAGSRNMIRAAYHAQELGASVEHTLELMQDINDYWVSPLQLQRFNGILKQVERLYNEA